MPLATAAGTVPRLPGVYMMRDRDGSVVYVGMAGDRSGGRKPSGMRGRLTVYASGKGAVSGFGEAAMDRALADENFIREQWTALRDGMPRRAKRWAQDAIEWHGVEVRWTVSTSEEEAKSTEDEVVALLRPSGLWNR